MSEVAFTYDWYERMLDALVDAGLETGPFDGPVDDRTLLLRHDVDWSPRKAVRLARMERRAGFSATFFFMTSSPFYNARDRYCRDAIDRILDLGHEVGLHFSTHQYWDERSSADAVESRVAEERRLLEDVAAEDASVVSFHNPPEWVLRESFSGFTSTYEPRFFDRIEYRADSNQRWRDEHPFEAGVPGPLQVLTHPVLWGEVDGSGVDRVREERDFVFERLQSFIAETYHPWPDGDGVPEVE